MSKRSDDCKSPNAAILREYHIEQYPDKAKLFEKEPVLEESDEAAF
jgi:hypothetical protein